MHLHLSPIGGLAGDMLCAALLHARPDLLVVVEESIACLGMAVPVRIALERVEGPLEGRRFRVRAEEPHPHEHPHHTPYAAIRRLLQATPLPEGVRGRALHAFALLAEAEGQVHGVPPKAVEFHEVGSWDSLADIVAAATLLEVLQIASASCGPLPLGSGRVQTAHGWLPVPAPATVRLLQGLPLVDDGVPGERVTPTGAAILRTLGPTAIARPGSLSGSGYGFGSRTLPGIPNCLQALLIAEPVPLPPMESDQVVSLSFEVDDQTPEDFAIALDLLRAQAGTLSVTALAGMGKGGRPTWRVDVLGDPSKLRGLAEACFRETPTLGLRWQLLPRFLLPRRATTLCLEGRTLGVKVAERPGGATAKVEARDLAGVPAYRAREDLRRAGAAHALAPGTDDD